jgi:electron transfer flavoprotein alpha/beta subunit
MKAARQPIEEVTHAVLGKASWEAFRGPYSVAVRKVSPPQQKGRATMIGGSLADQAKAVADLLREKGFYRGG